MSRPSALSGAPPLVIALSAVAIAFLAAPLAGLLLRAPWTDLPSQLSSPEVRAALALSLVASGSATAFALLFGIPLAWLLARVDFPGRGLVRALATFPLVLPPVVGGVALLLALGRLGLVGRLLDTLFGLTFFGTRAGVIVAETFVAMPFLVLTVEGALRSADRRYEEAAATLGAGRWLTFRRVTLPLVGPAVAAGAALAWARALGEFGATITFAGNLPGTTQTIPLAVYSELQKDLDGAIALSLVLVGISLAILIGLRGRWLLPS
jgi:molybdate transport system permease protein